MANTFELISSVTVGSAGSASIDFTSIPSSYKDLCLILSARSDAASANDYAYLRLNGSVVNYSMIRLSGNGSAMSSSSLTSIYSPFDAANNTTSTFGSAQFYIPSYGSANYKTVSIEGTIETNATTNIMDLNAGLWSDTSVISSITLTTLRGANFVQYSTAYLYGVKNA